MQTFKWSESGEGRGLSAKESPSQAFPDSLTTYLQDLIKQLAF